MDIQASQTSPSLPQRILLILLAVPFPVMAFVYALRHRTLVPFGDMLLFNLPLALAIEQSGGVWELLFTPFVGVHFQIPSGLVTITNANLMSWHPHYEQAMLLFLFTINYALLLTLLWGSGKKVFWRSLIPVSALFWTVLQDPNFYVGNHTMWMFVNLFVMLAVWLIDTGEVRIWRILGAGFCGIGATFSLISGWLLFPAMFPLILARTRQIKYVLLWLGLAALAFILLLVAFGGIPSLASDSDSTQTRSIQLLLAFPSMLVGSFMSIYFVRFSSAFVFGTVGFIWLATSAVLLWRNSAFLLLRRWGTLALFAVLSTILISLGRYDGGAIISQLLHYNTLAKLVWIVLIIFVCYGWDSIFRSPRRGWVVALSTCFILAHAWSTIEVWYGKQWYSPEAVVRYEQCLIDYPVTGETACLERIVAAPLEKIVPLVDAMYEYRIGFYRDWS